MSFSPSQLAVLSGLRSPLKAKPMPAEITDAKVGVSGSGHNQAVITLTPLDKGVKQESLALRLYVSKVDDSIAANPQALGRVKTKAYGFFRAVDKAFPTYPEKVSNGVFRTKDGQNLDYDAYSRMCKQVTEAVFERLENTDDAALKAIVGTKVFMCPQEAKLDESKRTSQFVGWIAGELNDGEEFLTTDLVDDEKLQEIMAAAMKEGDNA